MVQYFLLPHILRAKNRRILRKIQQETAEVCIYFRTREKSRFCETHFDTFETITPIFIMHYEAHSSLLFIFSLNLNTYHCDGVCVRVSALVFVRNRTNENVIVGFTRENEQIDRH